MLAQCYPAFEVAGQRENFSINKKIALKVTYMYLLIIEISFCVRIQENNVHTDVHVI